MKVIFLSPAYPVEMQHYVRGLCEVGAQVYGIGDGGIPETLKKYLSGYLKIDRLFDEKELFQKEQPMPQASEQIESKAFGNPSPYPQPRSVPTSELTE